jgi:hypothetical protein
MLGSATGHRAVTWLDRADLALSPSALMATTWNTALPLADVARGNMLMAQQPSVGKRRSDQHSTTPATRHLSRASSACRDRSDGSAGLRRGWPRGASEVPGGADSSRSVPAFRPAVRSIWDTATRRGFGTIGGSVPFLAKAPNFRLDAPGKGIPDGCETGMPHAPGGATRHIFGDTPPKGRDE